MTGAAQGAVVTVVSSGGFAGAFRVLAPQFSGQPGTLSSRNGGRRWGTPRTPFLPGSSAVSQSMCDHGWRCLRRFDQVRKSDRNSRVDLARWTSGLPFKGRTQTGHQLCRGVRRALMAAKSIAYSDSASGVYVSTELFSRLGLSIQLRAKAG